MFLKTIVMRSLPVAALLLATATEHSAQAQPGAARGFVRGVAFDSLVMKPLSGAAVWVSGASQSAVTDANGRFELADVAVGNQFIAFTSPALDSLGLGTLGATVKVDASADRDRPSAVMLATPSFATVWRALCAGTARAGADSGITWGSISDAAADTRLSGARVRFTWMEPQVTAAKKVEMVEKLRDVRTDSTGTYYACGLTVGTNLSAQGSGTRSQSGVLQYTIGARKLTRLDLLVSTEMIALKNASDSARADSGVWINPRGTSTVRGMVRDDKQRAQSAVTIAVAAFDTVIRTGADGSFSLSGLPAGTQLLEARKIGFASTNAVLDLRPGATTELLLTLSNVSELATVDVKGEAYISRDKLEYESRRKSGLGYALDTKSIENKYDLVSVLGTLPSLQVVRAMNGSISIAPPPASFRSPCRVKVWIDGIAATMDEASIIPVSDFRAIEWFPRGANAPTQYVGLQSCSVILFWTKLARWGEKK